MHFSIENFSEDFNMLTIISRFNILELNFVHGRMSSTGPSNMVELFHGSPFSNVFDNF